VENKNAVSYGGTSSTVGDRVLVSLALMVSEI